MAFADDVPAAQENSSSLCTMSLRCFIMKKKTKTLPTKSNTIMTHGITTSEITSKSFLLDIFSLLTANTAIYGSG